MTSMISKNNPPNNKNYSPSAAKANVEAVARAPGAAVGVASDAVGSIARVMGGIKDSAYGVADATAWLASLPGEVAERRRLEQQVRDMVPCI